MKDWQDIATAPKDSRAIIGYSRKVPEGWSRVGIGTNLDGDWMWSQDVPWEPATHWIPFTPPSTVSEAQESREQLLSDLRELAADAENDQPLTATDWIAEVCRQAIAALESRSSAQESREDDALTRSGELAADSPPQHAAAHTKG